MGALASGKAERKFAGDHAVWENMETLRKAARVWVNNHAAKDAFPSARPISPPKTIVFAEPTDEFALVNHPWQPALHLLHVVTVPLFVFALGLLWPTHIAPKLCSRATARRRSGIGLMALAVPMIASGYAVQVSVAVEWRTAWAWAHGVTSVLFLLLFLAHLAAATGHRPAAVGPAGTAD